MNNITSEEFDKKIVSECPILYKNRHAPMNQTCMCWGFDIGKGWYDLVYNLSKKIEKINQTLPEKQKCIAAQVKSKYGSLRFYTDGGNEETDKLISKAERKSCKICEECGNKGKEITLCGWVYTLCNKCKEKEEKRLNIIYKKDKNANKN